MNATGMLFLANARPVTTTAADGTFTLTLRAMDRIGPHQVEPWLITWPGDAARAFWAAHASQMRPGQPITVQARCVRPWSIGRHLAPEIHAQATHIELAPLSGTQNTVQPSSTEREQLSKSEQPQPVDIMAEPIISRERIEREARALARTHDNVNDACRYPFGTAAGQLFKAEFIRARAVIAAANYSNTTIPATTTTQEAAQ
ncbi:MAG: hypothetical protein WAW73_09415 [Rhodoferax sp.]